MASADQCSISMIFSGTEAHQNKSLNIQNRITKSHQQWCEWLGDGSDLGCKSGTDFFVVFPIICTGAGGSGPRAELFTAAATAALTIPQDSLKPRAHVGAASNVPIPPDFRDFQFGSSNASFIGGNFGQSSTFGGNLRCQLSFQYSAKNLLHPSGQDHSLPNDQRYYCEVTLVKAYTAAAAAGLTMPQYSLKPRAHVGAASNIPFPPDFTGFQLGNSGANFTGGVFGQPVTFGGSLRRQLQSQYNAKDLLTIDLLHPSGQDHLLPNDKCYCGVILAKAYSKGSLKKHGVQLCIGIAAGVVVLIAIVVAIFLWRRCRQGGRRHEKHSYAPINDGDNV